MTTYRYFANAAPSYTPTLRGGPSSSNWNDTAGDVAVKLGAKEGAVATVARGETSTSNTWDIALLVAVADIGADGTIASGDTIDIRVGRRASATSSFQLACFAWVCAGDTNTVRTDLLTTFYVSGVNWATTDGFTGFTITIQSDKTVSAGDHVVVELGARAVNTTSSSRTATLHYGGSGPDSLDTPPTGAPPTQSGWVRFTGAVESLLAGVTPPPASAFLPFTW